MGGRAESIRRHEPLAPARVALLLGLLAAIPAAAQQVESGFTVRSAVVGETVPFLIRVQRTGRDVEKELATPEVPAGEGYVARFSDRRDSQSEQVTIINGEMRRSLTVTTQFVYDVTPSRPGVIAIPGFDIDVLGKRQRLREATLRVEAEAPGNRYVEVRVTTHPPSAWVNQPLTVRIEVVSTKPFLSDPEPAFSIPWFSAPDGLVGDAPEPARQRERGRMPIQIGDQYYNFTNQEISQGGATKYRLSFERDLVPVRPGKVTLDAAQFSGAVAEQLGRDVFGQTVARSSARVVKTSAPLVLEVRDVPEAGKPAGFTNAVGDLAVTVKAGPAQIKAGDPVTITLTVAGRGNIEGIRLPDLAGFEGFTRYDPETTVEPGVEGDPKKKRLTATWLVFPKSADQKEIPAVAFSWFDTTTGKYRAESVGPIPLAITGTFGDAPLVVGRGGPASKRSIEVARDILAIKPDYGALRPAHDEGLGPGTIALIVLPILSFAATASLVRRRERLSGDAGLRRRVVASKAARERLAAAAEVARSGGDVAGPLSAALAGFVADKLALPPASVTAATIARDLRTRGVPDDVAADAARLLGELDLRRFSVGAGGTSDASALIRRVESALAAIERRLR